MLNFVMNFELLDYDSASNTVEGENDTQFCMESMYGIMISKYLS